MPNPTFGRETTIDELLEGVDLSGRRVLVTGGSAGLGAETVRALAAHGAHVIMPVRDLAKGERAAAVAREAARSGGYGRAVRARARVTRERPRLRRPAGRAPARRCTS